MDHEHAPGQPLLWGLCSPQYQPMRQDRRQLVRAAGQGPPLPLLHSGWAHAGRVRPPPAKSRRASVSRVPPRRAPAYACMHLHGVLHPPMASLHAHLHDWPAMREDATHWPPAGTSLGPQGDCWAGQHVRLHDLARIGSERGKRGEGVGGSARLVPWPPIVLPPELCLSPAPLVRQTYTKRLSAVNREAMQGRDQ
jgi:hypothetical protein